MKRASLLTLCGLALAMPAAFAAPSVTTVMSGLDNPRGLAFGPEGALYVVEAGRGGTGPCAILRGQPRCYGPTGALTRLWRGRQERVAAGLPSYADAAVLETTGPHDVSFIGRGTAYVTVGFGSDPALRAGFGEVGQLFGTVVQVSAGGQWRVVADVSAHESAANPAGGPVDSNPYGALAEPGAVIVADAGANALLRVAANGTVSTFAMFPSRPARSTDSVPTAVVRGPDGAYYVGELTGVPFAQGAARVYRVVEGEAPSVYADGFKTIIDLDFGPDGSLYVLEHASGPMFFAGPGRIVQVAPDGSRSVVLGGLSQPTSLLVGPDGALYVSNRGTSILTGEVLRIVP
ncbi:ScyD/ScyE family protein [Vulcaniibacterium gelatinicum]|uniref:ScyD/ScyE family protein n=1 Tax=Vulcaniibacterium gelatinicum TaxID=2598725 RepID=UPI0011C95612|nr:ScyD/ScyE family protein [Vulcaniibacterium gelatinicum]